VSPPATTQPTAPCSSPEATLPVVNARVSQLTVLNPHDGRRSETTATRSRSSTEGRPTRPQHRHDAPRSAPDSGKREHQGFSRRAIPPTASTNLSISRFGAVQRQSRRQPRRADSAERRQQRNRRRFTLAVRNTKFSGFGGGFGILNASTRNAQRGSSRTRRCRTSPPRPADAIAAVTVTHPADKRIGTAVHRSRWRAARQPRRNRFVKNAGLDVVGIECQRRDRSESESMPRELLGRGTARDGVRAAWCAEAGRRRPGRRSRSAATSRSPPRRI